MYCASNDRSAGRIRTEELAKLSAISGGRNAGCVLSLPVQATALRRCLLRPKTEKWRAVVAVIRTWKSGRWATFA